jgi:CheY-like chemotaxis protein
VQKILIVDDMASVRAGLAACLEGMAVQISFAEDGAAALKLLKGEKFDVALLDLQMPVLDGPQLLRLLKGQTFTCDFIFVTATSSRAALAELFKLGVSDYIAKPFRKDEVREKVERALSRRRVAVGTATRSAAAMSARPPRDLLVMSADPDLKTAFPSLIPPATTVLYADDGTNAVRYSRLFKFHALVVDPQLPALEWKAIAIIQPGALVFTIGDPSGLPAHVVLPNPIVTAQPILDALSADMGQLRVTDDLVVHIRPGAGGPARGYRRAADLLSEAIEKLAEARAKGIIVDITALVSGGERLVQLVRQMADWTDEQGLRLILVGTSVIAAELATDPRAAAVPFFTEVGQATASLRRFEDE